MLAMEHQIWECAFYRMTTYSLPDMFTRNRADVQKSWPISSFYIKCEAMTIDIWWHDFYGFLSYLQEVLESHHCCQHSLPESQMKNRHQRQRFLRQQCYRTCLYFILVDMRKFLVTLSKSRMFLHNLNWSKAPSCLLGYSIWGRQSGYAIAWDVQASKWDRALNQFGLCTNTNLSVRKHQMTLTESSENS